MSVCNKCDEELIRLDGSYRCPECENLSVFETTPEKDSFSL